jgi:hypothetical protein
MTRHILIIKSDCPVLKNLLTLKSALEALPNDSTGFQFSVKDEHTDLFFNSSMLGDVSKTFSLVERREFELHQRFTK